MLLFTEMVVVAILLLNELLVEAGLLFVEVVVEAMLFFSTVVAAAVSWVGDPVVLIGSLSFTVVIIYSVVLWEIVGVCVAVALNETM